MKEQATVVVVSGSRADYGLLVPVMRSLQSSAKLRMKFLVTGEHTRADRSAQVRGMEADGFHVDEWVELPMDSRDGLDACRSVSVGIVRLADALRRLSPGIVFLLGDRYEIFAAAQAALFMRRPVAHACGGDSTAGAFDESLRHCISKLSHLHFPTNSKAARRLVQMGEHPSRVHMTGSPGVDALLAVARLGRQELTNACGIRWYGKNVLLTFHPVTLEPGEGLRQLDAVCADLLGMDENLGILATACNTDPEGERMNARLRELSAANPRFQFFQTLGTQKYASVMAEVDVVVGNSSSGLYEAPTLKVPTVNIGERQKGRLQASSVLQCRPERGEVAAAVRRALALDCSGAVNPYGSGGAAGKILAVLESVESFECLLKKDFHDSGPES